jgi:hypothetical protein
VISLVVVGGSEREETIDPAVQELSSDDALPTCAWRNADTSGGSGGRPLLLPRGGGLIAARALFLTARSTVLPRSWLSGQPTHVSCPLRAIAGVPLWSALGRTCRYQEAEPDPCDGDNQCSEQAIRRDEQQVTNRTGLGTSFSG